MKIKINKLAVEAFMFVIIMTLINFILSCMGFYGEPFENTYVFDDQILSAVWTDIMIISLYLIFSVSIFVELNKIKVNWSNFCFIDKKIIILLNIASVSAIIIAACYLLKNISSDSTFVFLIMEIIIILLSVLLINFKRYLL